MTPTPTPRTDAESFRSCIGDWGFGEFVPASFARDLERQLAAERALADRLAETIQSLPAHVKTNINPQALAAWKEARGA